jgi:Cdc6-like AAA superfamily ATPase
LPWTDWNTIGIRQASKLEQLSSFDNSIAYRKARTQQHISTGQWNTRAGKVINWITESRSSVFLCTGAPGTGKTVMTAYVIEALSAKYIQSSEKLVYFFCEYDNEHSSQATTIIQSIIRQLLDQEDDAFTANETSINELLKDPHDLGLLQNLLSDVIGSWHSVVVILDGLDECSLTELELLLKTLHNIIRRQTTGLKLYLSGDDRISDLVKSLLNPGFVVVARMPEAELDLVELVQQLVNARREDGDLVVDDHSLYQEVIDVLCTRSQGM